MFQVPFVLSSSALFFELLRVGNEVFDKIMGFYWSLVMWGGRRDLNPRHSEPQSDALPAELLPPQVEQSAVYRVFEGAERVITP